MKSNFKKLHKHRCYSDAFKKLLVADFESGQYSVPQLERLHGIGNRTIYNWIYKFPSLTRRDVELWK